jgi:HEAT repeat protein
VNKGPLIALLALAIAGGVMWAMRKDPAGGLESERRPAFELPVPTGPEKARYFYDLLGSGRTWRIGETSAPLWRVLGKSGLLEGGKDSLDFVLSEDRYEDYYRSGNRLLMLLKWLQEFSGVQDHPRTEPFLRYWLDPKNSPPDTPGSRPAEEYRKRIFRIFRHYPVAWAVPYCVDEILRKERYHDLRVEAIGVLLYLGETGPVEANWEIIPPTEKEAQPLLKEFTLGQVRTYAGPEQPPKRREGARRLEPLARRTLEDGALYAKVSAASTLLRLGDESMVDRMLELIEQARTLEDRDIYWSALLLLAEDSDDARIRAICEERTKGEIDTADFTYRTALKVLAYNWIDEPEVRAKLWAYVDATKMSDLAPLQWLIRVASERERIVEYLRGAIRGEDFDKRLQAVRFATHAANPVPEVMKDLYDVAKTTAPDRGRTRYLNALVNMRFEPVVPLLLADLADELEVLRQAAAANLLEFDDENGIASVADRLEGGDLAMLAPIVTRAQARGRAGVRDALVPALLRTLATAPGEEGRMRVLYALRCRGSLEGVRKPLMDAYCREPSRRVAAAIRETLVELAHRWK